jgi:hypothetical protein
MAYSKYTSLTKFCNEYNLIQNTTENFINPSDIVSFEVSQRLLEDLDEAKKFPLLTEKAKSELIIMPILKELRRKNPNITFFSGFSLNIEGDSNLNGNPDFVLSAKPNLVEIEAPIFCLMESKNKSPDEGFAQCAAEMYAARLFNQQMNEPYETIYGAVTNAFEWIFLRLEKNVIQIDTERYFLNDLPKLFGVMQFIVNKSMI